MRCSQNQHRKFFGPGNKPENKQPESGGRFRGAPKSNSPERGDAEPEVDKTDIFDFVLAYLLEVNGGGTLSIDHGDFSGFVQSLQDCKEFGLAAYVPEGVDPPRLILQLNRN